MDILKQAAFAYRKLLDKEYVITVGKNNVKRSYIVQFTTNEFKHICGLHKLKDMNDVYRSSSNALFHKILHSEITIGDIQKAEAFSKIEARLKNAAYLEEYFDKFTVIYDWNQEKSKFSNIDADLMIPIHSAMLSNLETYIFLKNSGRKETLSLSDYIVENPEFNRVETSIVDKKDYRQGQVRPPALLYKEKIILSDQSSEILFDRLSLSTEKELSANGTNRAGGQTNSFNVEPNPSPKGVARSEKKINGNLPSSKETPKRPSVLAALKTAKSIADEHNQAHLPKNKKKDKDQSL